jgi:hypothetical protein
MPIRGQGNKIDDAANGHSPGEIGEERDTPTQHCDQNNAIFVSLGKFVSEALDGCRDLGFVEQ